MKKLTTEPVFVWIDDAPLRVEIETLRGRGLLNRLLIVDSDDGLARAVDAIKRQHSLFEASRRISGGRLRCSTRSGDPFDGPRARTDNSEVQVVQCD
jgi:hypothetical protein